MTMKRSWIWKVEHRERDQRLRLTKYIPNTWCTTWTKISSCNFLSIIFLLWAQHIKTQLFISILENNTCFRLNDSDLALTIETLIVSWNFLRHGLTNRLWRWMIIRKPQFSLTKLVSICKWFEIQLGQERENQLMFAFLHKKERHWRSLVQFITEVWYPSLFDSRRPSRNERLLYNQTYLLQTW